VDTLKAELFAFKEDVIATWEMAEETRKIAKQVKATLGEPGVAITKAKLFDEKMHEEKKLSGSRIVRILSDFAKQVEAAMMDTRRTTDRIEESSRKLVGATCSKGIHLLDISLSDSFPDSSNLGAGKDRTPESKKSGRRTVPVNTPSDRIVWDSTPGSSQEAPIPGSEGDRNWNLNNIFEQMESGVKSPTVGSRM